MASYGVRRAKHATLTGTTVDTVSLSEGKVSSLNIYNRSGGVPLWVRVAGDGGSAATPTEAGDDAYVVPVGAALTLEVDTDGGDSSGAVEVKILGNGNAYSVQALA